MAFVIIAGVTYEVLTTGATMNTPERVGASRRNYVGDLYTSVQAEKLNWNFPLAPMTQAVFETLYNNTKNAVSVAVGGDALPSGGITAEVEISSADYIKDDNQSNDFQRLVTVKVTQI